MKATKLKPKVAMLTAPVRSFISTPRMRGAALQDRNFEILAREPMCRCCKKRAAREIDHIVPLFMGGEDIEGNLQPLCVICHKAKTRNEAGGGWFDLAGGRDETAGFAFAEIKLPFSTG